MKFLMLTLALAAGMAHAEDKTCQVAGMHCSGCVEMVQSKICGTGSKYATCDIKLVDEKKELGQMHLVTKDAKTAIDEKALSASVKDAGYTLQKCTATGASKGKS